MFKRERTSSPCVSSLKRVDILRNDSHFLRIGALGLIFLLPLENFAPNRHLAFAVGEDLIPAVNGRHDLIQRVKPAILASSQRSAHNFSASKRAPAVRTVEPLTPSIDPVRRAISALQCPPAN